MPAPSVVDLHVGPDEIPEFGRALIDLLKRRRQNIGLSPGLRLRAWKRARVTTLRAFVGEANALVFYVPLGMMRPMRKIAALSLVLGIVAVVACASLQSTAVGELKPHMIARIETPFSFGTGFPVAKENGHVAFLTASHVVKNFNPDEVLVRIGSRVSSSIRIVKYESRDVAVVWTTDDYVEDVFDVRREPPKFGEPVRMLGWFIGSHLIVTSGNIGQDSFSAPFFFGMSGGPLLDENLKVIGIGLGFTNYLDGPVEHPLSMANSYETMVEILDWLRENHVID